ncbi:beta-N-acetylhexosaminidase [Catenovulum sp. SM1970]|uniref:beta-N-acetylhexosaminidase n=1 Tax=Marinifaba aquimaris TaxID=2741323 RepID=UPI0015746CD1|nr:beta-N-acetylhexosaminidase [Marinifaba aquimaris]NTS76088.1 beta-N-acetylhexosaminidase [Marinifaba aquimaris]
MLDVQGYELNPEEKEMIAHPFSGGLILFARNFHDVKQLQELTRQIREASPEPILIAVDQEGGRVQRFLEGFVKIPPMASFEKAYSDEAQQLKAASDIAWLMATEVMACDIDISFAPVLDLNRISKVIGHRSFSAEPETALRLAQAFIRGLKQAGMKATGKHFPGHGSVGADSHIAMPIDDRSFEEISQVDMSIFTSLIADNHLDAIMPAHVIYSQIDKKPAGFSSKWLQQILRKQLGFNGVIFSDDLSMEAANYAGGYVAKAEAALHAGCDMVLVCNEPKGAAQVLDAYQQLKPLVAKDARSMVKHQLYRFDELKSSAKWQQAQQLADKLNQL